jgi:hypothetical protein
VTAVTLVVLVVLEATVVVDEAVVVVGAEEGLAEEDVAVLESADREAEYAEHLSLPTFAARLRSVKLQFASKQGVTRVAIAA